MIAVIWEFTIKENHQAEFERLYGADGSWTALARKSRSYLGSSFLRDLAQTTRYLVTEYWSEMIVYERHLEDFRDQIAKLDERRSQLVESAQPLGLFQALDVPDRFGPTWSQRRGLA